MRKYLLLLIASLSLTVTHAQTNMYHPFPDTNAVWTVVDRMSHAGSHCENISWDRSYIQTGKVSINSIQYNALYLNEHCTEAWIPAPPPATPCYYDYGVTTGTFVGGLRNDTVNKKVYYYDNNKSQEYLLYDFSVSIGDSIEDWLGSGGYYKITSIDSALVGTIYHKRFNINGGFNNDTSIIEGVGSSTGLLGPYSFFENFNQLVCFSVLGQTMYINPNSFGSCGVVGINETEDNSYFSIFPNPFSTQTTFQTAERLQNASLTVYNSVGQTVKHVDNLSSQTVIFHRDNLPSGLYFVRLTQDGNTISSNKFVITDR